MKLESKSQSLLFEVFFPINNIQQEEIWAMTMSQSLLFEVFFPIARPIAGWCKECGVAIPSF